MRIPFLPPLSSGALLAVFRLVESLKQQVGIHWRGDFAHIAVTSFFLRKAATTV
jgi:hypothetical protein